MLNTYGLRSINSDTFNLKWHTNYTYPRELRNVVVTFLKVHNLALNICGYIPRFSTMSGCTRMATGLFICLLPLTIGNRKAESGFIIGHWYDEALLTGIAQVARGAIEAFMPYGRAINISLDIIGTFPNLLTEATMASTCTECMGYKNHEPYTNPEYPLFFKVLDLV